MFLLISLLLVLMSGFMVEVIVCLIELCFILLRVDNVNRRVSSFFLCYLLVVVMDEVIWNRLFLRLLKFRLVFFSFGVVLDFWIVVRKVCRRMRCMIVLLLVVFFWSIVLVLERYVFFFELRFLFVICWIVNIVRLYSKEKRCWVLVLLFVVEIRIVLIVFKWLKFIFL